MLKCKACGALIELGADFCPRCGERQADALPVAAGVGRKTKYCPNCGRLIDEAAEICPACGVRVSAAQQVAVRLGEHNKITAGLFALLLGGIGIHKFYLGQVGQGILCILFCWTGIPAIIALVDGIVFLSMSDADFDARFNAPVG
ncbi:MAG: NINE protein [Caldiserica bacterium]|nr:NINE protein [Caldisericota bacterium]